MVDTLWYYARNQQKIGPVPLAQIQRLAASGQLRSTDMVLQQGTQKWITVEAALGLAAPLPQANVLPHSAEGAQASPKNTSVGERYWLLIGGIPQGPFTVEQIRNWEAAGQTSAGMLVCPEGGKEWRTLGQVLGTRGISDDRILEVIPAEALAPFPQARAPIGDGQRPLTVIPTGACPSSRPTLDIIFAVGAIASIPCWAIGELFDAPLLLIAAGSVFLAFASRAIITGSAVDFTGRLRTSPSYRVAGVVVGLLGLAVVYHGSKQLIAKVRDSRTQSASGWQSTTGSGDGQAHPESEAKKKAMAHFERGLTHQQREEHDQAIAAYTAAIQLNPTNPGFFYNRGLAFGNNKDYDRAVTDLTEAIQLFSQSPGSPRLADAYASRGEAYLRKNALDLALADMSEVIRLSPNDPKAYASRGWIYLKKEDADRAIADFTYVVRLDPKLAEGYQNRALGHLMKGRFDEAMADCTNAIELEPRMAKAYYLRGKIHEAKGNQAQAQADFQQAAQLAPSLPK